MFLITKLKIILLFLPFASFALMAADKVVRVVSLEDYAPFVFVANKENKGVAGIVSQQDQGEAVDGFSWEVFRDSFLAMGYSIKFTIVPWARAVDTLKSGRADVLFPMGRNKERLQLFRFSRETVNKIDFVLYVTKNSKFSWQGLTSLENKIIGVKRGFNYGDQWNALTSVKKYDIGKIANGFRMLAQGHLDGFIGYKQSWDYVLKQHGWENKFREIPVFQPAHEFVVSLDNQAHAVALLDVYDKGKQKLIESGRLVELNKKWFGVKQ